MSSKKIILSKEAPAPIGPYSQAVVVGNLIFCSGQIPLDPVSGHIVGTGDIKVQTEQVLKNIAAVLKGADSNLSHVVKTTIFLTNMNDFGAVNEIYSQYFTSQAPARTTVAVSTLPRNVNVEIEVIAHR